MSVEQYPVIVYSSGLAVSAGDSSYAEVLQAGGNDMIVATSGGVVAETSMGAGTLVVASGAVISGINIDDDGAVFSGTDVFCSGAEKWYGPAACATFGSIVLEGGTFTRNSAFASGGYLGQGGALEAHEGSISVSGGVYTSNTATGGGGAILAIGGATEIVGAEFSGNEGSLVETQAVTLHFACIRAAPETVKHIRHLTFGYAAACISYREDISVFILIYSYGNTAAVAVFDRIIEKLYKDTGNAFLVRSDHDTALHIDLIRDP